jgi:uncharacterized protein with HEPN domain
LPSKHPRLRLLDIIQNIDAIQTYTRGMNGEAFAATNLVIDAVERCLGRISEAAKRLGKSAEDLAPGQPWKKIRGFGNVLRHEYETVRHDLTWEIVTGLTSLRQACEQAIVALDNQKK